MRERIDGLLTGTPRWPPQAGGAPIGALPFAGCCFIGSLASSLRCGRAPHWSCVPGRLSPAGDRRKTGASPPGGVSGLPSISHWKLSTRGSAGLFLTATVSPHRGRSWPPHRDVPCRPDVLLPTAEVAGALEKRAVTARAARNNWPRAAGLACTRDGVAGPRRGRRVGRHAPLAPSVVAEQQPPVATSAPRPARPVHPRRVGVVPSRSRRTPHVGDPWSAAPRSPAVRPAATDGAHRRSRRAAPGRTRRSAGR